MKKTWLNNSLKFSGLLILTILILTACAAPTEMSQPNQPELDPSNPATAELPLPDDNVTPDLFSEEEDIVDIEEIEQTKENIASELVNTDESTEVITDTEKAGLIFMREEEKLAHDVYLALYDLWGLPLFQNIARSEESHTGAVKRLLDTFVIPDPADQSPPGTFQDKTLQDLYDQLMEQGANSLSDALKVGAVIEEIDILDLEEYISETTNPEIQRVYENLLRGSENHLRAFTSTLLRQTGETYQPQYMDITTYDRILASANERDNRNNNRRP